MDNENMITIDKRQLKATLFEMGVCITTISDMIRLCQNHLDDQGDVVGNEITPSGIEVLLALCLKTVSRHHNLSENMEDFYPELKTTIDDSQLGLLDNPKLGKTFYPEITDEAEVA